MSAPSKIFIAMVGNDTDGKTHKCDAIEYDGKLWLVPHWLEVLEHKVSKPARMIRFDNQPHQDVWGSKLADYFLKEPLPNCWSEPPRSIQYPGSNTWSSQTLRSRTLYGL